MEEVKINVFFLCFVKFIVQILVNTFGIFKLFQHVHHGVINLGGFFGKFLGKSGLIIDFNKSRGCFVVMVMVHKYVMLVMVVP